MLGSIISWALRSRWLVLAGAGVLALAGFVALNHLNIDAFPDTTPVQVQVNTEATALVATEVERLITFPIEMAVGGIPGLVSVRSISQFGLSQVTLTFEDGTDIYLVRQIIAQRISGLPMPPGIQRPELGPVATGLGEVLHYLVVPTRRHGMDLNDLRTTQDWRIRPEMRTVPGAAEINSWGGMEKQYQVRIDPVRLFQYDLSLQNVLDAVRNGNLNVGGGYLDRQGDMLLIHGIGRTTTLEQIEDMVLASRNGVPVYVKDVAQVAIGHEIRRGIVTAEGQGEAVLGLGFMRIGANSYAVTQRMAEQLAEVSRRLPPGARVEKVYDRTELVDDVIATVRSNLLEGAILVVAILLIFLGNLRAGLIAAATIPLSLLFAFCGMWPAGIAGTLLSLGAIDFGIVVDSSVVMLENIVRRLGHASEHGFPPGQTRLGVIRNAAREVAVPTVFGQLIIMIVYLPILTLEGVEGKMFRPMALTVMLVLAGSGVLALTLTPALASLFLPRNLDEKEVWLVRGARWLYRPLLRGVLAAPWRAAAVGGAALGFALLVARGLGTEFVPQLSEGALVIGLLRVPGTSLEQSAAMNLEIENHLKTTYPDEVAHVWSRVGEPEINTDAGTPESTDMFVTLKPRQQWKKARSQDQLVELLSKDLQRFKGQAMWFTQPIEMRLNEMLTGSRADLALKLFGEDIDTLVAKSTELEKLLRAVPGCADLTTEQVLGQPILEVRLRQDQLARYGVQAQTVLDVLEAAGGKSVGDVIEGQLRFPLAVRLPERLRDTPYAIASITVPAPSGEQLPLSRLAHVREIRGPKLISGEWGRRRVMLQCNVRGRDIGSFVAEAQGLIREQFRLPQGYRLEWGGQFENMVRAQQRLLLVVPLALGLIVGLLYLTYRNFRDTFLVFASVPFACIGGVLTLWLRGMPISISAAVGFITLSGVSVLNSMIFMARLQAAPPEGDVRLSILAAGLGCLRTVMMTALVASVGFIPMALSTGTGAEVQRPLATVVIGGVVTSTLMTLLVLPALCVLARRKAAAGLPSEPRTELAQSAE
jgi:cobalt-zinc-cadmium resistance protein CzcA